MTEILRDDEDEIREEDTSIDPPRWIDALVIPAVNVGAALGISALVILFLGENPFSAMRYLIRGAIGYQEALGYTLFYTTSFVFTGLAVAVAFHCGLLNLGGEGQAYIGGLGIALVCLGADFLPAPMILVLGVGLGVLFGAVWGAIPGYLQGARGSHIVITTIMFNYLAASLMSYLMLNYLIDPGQTAPATREFAKVAWLPKIHEVLAANGYTFAPSPLNVSIIFAFLCAILVWIMIGRTSMGYEMRVVGKGHLAARYAGISPTRSIVLAMAISGGLASFLGINELMGSQHRLALDFAGGYGLAGVAVALMARNHPFGIFLSAFLFGALYQGGSELSFEIPAIPREMIVLIQGLVILFSGALASVFRPQIAALWYRRHETREAWRRRREKWREALDRRRQRRKPRRKTAPRPDVRGKPPVQQVQKKQPAPQPVVVVDAASAQDLARQRGEADFRDLLRRRGQLPEPEPAKPKPRRRWWSRLPKLPKISVTVQRDDPDDDGRD